MTLDSYFYTKINSEEKLLDRKYRERWERERGHHKNVTIIFCLIYNSYQGCFVPVGEI